MRAWVKGMAIGLIWGVIAYPSFLFLVYLRGWERPFTSPLEKIFWEDVLRWIFFFPEMKL